MKGKDIFDAFGALDEEILLDCAPGQKKKKAKTLRVIAIFAAAAILAAAIPFGVVMSKTPEDPPVPTTGQPADKTTQTETAGSLAPTSGQSADKTTPTGTTQQVTPTSGEDQPAEDDQYEHPYYDFFEDFESGGFMILSDETPVTDDPTADVWCKACRVLPPTKAELLEKAAAYKRTGFSLNADGESYTWYGPERGASLENCVVPTEYKGKPVTAIGTLAFLDCRIGSVSIPEGITRIADAAFYLTSIDEPLVLPESLREVQLSSFSSLAGFTFENGAVYCGTKDNPHYYLLSVHKDADDRIHIHPQTRVFAKVAFELNSTCESLVLPAQLKYIVSGAIKWAPKLREIIFDGESENYEIKKGCLIEKESGRLIIGLPGSEIPRDGSVKEICDFAFSGNVPLDLDIPDGVRVIGEGAFHERSAEERTLKLPEGLVYVGASAFWGLPIREAVLPSTVAYLGDEAFANNQVLEKLVLSDALEYFGILEYSFGLGEYAESQLKRLLGTLETTLRDGVHYLGSEKNPYIAVIATEALAGGRIVLPDGVRFIGAYAFKKRNISRIELPEGLISIGKSAFEQCFTGEKDEIVLPESLRSIGECAFSNARIKRVKFLSAVESIPYRAFFHAGISGEVTIPEGTVFIGKEAFAKDQYDRITALNLPSTLRSVGEGAFKGGRLKELHVPAKLSYIGFDAFEGSEDLTMKNEEYRKFCEEYGDVGKIWGIYNGEDADTVHAIGIRSIERITVDPKNPFYRVSGNCLIVKASGRLILGCRNSVIPDDGSVKSIGSKAFSNCLLRDLTLPEGIVSIEYAAFGGCKIISLTLPQSLRTIGSCAFQGATLRSIVLPEGLTEIGAHAFEYASLEEIEIPGGVKKICSGAFSNTKIVSVILHEGIEEIGENAFYYVPVEKLVLPETLKCILRGAFNGSRLKELRIPAGVELIGSGAFYAGSLESITVDQGNERYYSVGNCLIDRSGKLVLAGVNAVLPQDGSILTIGRDAFLGVQSLTHLVVPEGVETIEEAFTESGLQSIVIPLSVKLLSDYALRIYRNGRTTEDLIVYYRGYESNWVKIEKKQYATRSVAKIKYFWWRDVYTEATDRIGRTVP